MPRTPGEPSPEAVLDAMNTCEPYTVSEVAEQFDASAATVRRRLEDLHDQGRVRKKKHAPNRVEWWTTA